MTTKEYIREYRKNPRNLEKHRKYNKEYNQNHKKECKEYNQNHREEFKVWRKNYRIKHRKQLTKATQKYRENNKEKVNKYSNEYVKNRYKLDSMFKISHCLRGRIRDALKNNRKSNHTLELLGCSIEELKNHLEKQFQLGMSWGNYGEWHIDHILPCSAFDLRNSEEQEICFHYTNLQPLWNKENISKGNKIL